MKQQTCKTNCKQTGETQTNELLILPGGKILAHNITPMMAKVLSELNPADEPMRKRANPKSSFTHELPN